MFCFLASLQRSTVQNSLWESHVPHRCPLRAWHIFFQRAKLHTSVYGWLVAKQKSRISCGGGLLQPFLHEFYGKHVRGRAGTTSLFSQSKFCAWICWTELGNFLTELWWPWSWDGSNPAATWLLALTVYPIYSHGHQLLFQHGLTLVRNIPQWQKSSFSLFRLQLLGNSRLAVSAPSWAELALLVGLWICKTCKSG